MTKHPHGTTDVSGVWWPDWWGRYVGRPLHEGATQDVLSATTCRRLASLSTGSRRRVKAKGMHAEFVDLIAVGFEQQWKCFICGLPFEHMNSKRSPKRLSVEHDPPLSKCGLHTRETVHLAHWDCNNKKGNSHGAE